MGWPWYQFIAPGGGFLVYRELSAILDAQLLPTFWKPNSWAPFSWLLRPTFYRTLWTVKVNSLVKKLGAVALNYLYLQEIDPWWPSPIYRVWISKPCWLHRYLLPCGNSKCMAFTPQCNLWASKPFNNPTNQIWLSLFWKWVRGLEPGPFEL